MCMIGGENKDYNRYVVQYGLWYKLHEILLSVGLGHLLLSVGVGLGLSQCEMLFFHDK